MKLHFIPRIKFQNTAHKIQFIGGFEYGRSDSNYIWKRWRR